ncbi:MULTISPECIES: RluA family pseudouridine synthase [Gordonibacter]|uniref:Pseudouridine synthase n=1 Tax=Gordonibacter faecis TaxID=3047475 RepID=A0ABT7DIL9_9ACTN|nr:MULTISPECIES: RluA family pseudouridine synthase [unclassified Gordonibacter]MDJ1649375.1 RluA family pseudouridine synthase [Gordonibacter sp. KGMB12511]HIW75158.1 RluA family pseudouridine synthase [Candidatus Gordonibacter avicola]
MSRSLCHIVAAPDAGMRLDALLAERGLYPSRSAAARAIEEGVVFVNGTVVAKKYAVASGDTIVYEVSEDPAPTKLEGQPIDLDVRFEDDHLMVLSKQAGLVCHPSVDHYDGTLVNALVYRCGAGNLCNVQGEDDRLGIVHRLDRDTTGLMLVAKDNATGEALMADIRDRAVDRRYLALVHGVIAHDTGMIDAPIARSANERTRMAIRDVPSARDAVTTFRVLERFEHGSRDDGYTLIDCKLFTGRTHQIRVHMEYAKHPLVGEPVYTSNAPKDAAANCGLERQFLHSFMLSFEHPMTGESLSFADNLPADLQGVLDALAPRSTGRTEAGDEVFSLLSNAPHPYL